MLTPDDRVVLHMRPGCHVCARVKAFLTDNGVPFQTRDVDADPLTPRELWELLTRKANRLRVPFTVLNDGEDVVLGHDVLRLEGVFLQGDKGGWQASAALAEPLVVDPRDAAAWTGDGAVTPDDDTWSWLTGALLSAQRFATPPGTRLTAEVGLAAGVSDGHASVALHDVPGGIVLGFGAAAGTVFAIAERLPVPGVVAPGESWSHRVPIDGDAARRSRYAIDYDHDAGTVRWLVDGERAYWSTLPQPLEGVSLGQGVHADGAVPRIRPAPAVSDERVAVTPWRVTLTRSDG